MLGPLLFIMFVDDLMSHIKNSYPCADDCLLLTSGNNPASSTVPTEQTIAQASDRYDKDLLVLYASKIYVTAISNCHNIRSNLLFGGFSFEQPVTIKNLGVINGIIIYLVCIESKNIPTTP